MKKCIYRMVLALDAAFIRLQDVVGRILRKHTANAEPFLPSLSWDVKAMMQTLVALFCACVFETLPRFETKFGVPSFMSGDPHRSPVRLARKIRRDWKFLARDLDSEFPKCADRWPALLAMVKTMEDLPNDPSEAAVPSADIS